VLEDMSPEDFDDLISAAPMAEKAALLEVIQELNTRKERSQSRKDFLAFTNSVWPDFISGAHHRRIAKLFEAVARGEKKRIIINLGPRHTKSEFASYLLPAWFLGQFPKKKIMQISNTGELAEGFGRKVRNLVNSDEYRRIFPDVELRTDSKAAGRWNTNFNGEYFAAGVGGTVTGRGADLLIIDDPHSEGEAVVAQHNPEIYDKVFSWYSSGPRQRLQPQGAIIIVMCMTGDTSVLMCTGATKQLKDLCVGDEVATYDNGELSTAKVLNHQSNGVDKVWKIRTTSGIIVRANERHPFLVDDKGVRRWIRLQDLTVGMSLVALKDVIDTQGHKLNLDFVDRAKLVKAIIKETQMPHTEKLGFMVSIRVKFAKLRDVPQRCMLKICAKPTTKKLDGLREKVEKPQKKHERIESKAGMASLLTTISKWLKIKTVNVLYVMSPLQHKILGRTGVVSCVSTIATTLVKLGRYCATTVILQLGTQKQKKQLLQLQSTSEFITDKIVEISFDCEEEVFDVEIDRTENFIANGIVSHNTRWSMRDLTGQILEHSAMNGGDKWEVVEFPAILPSGKPLWPEFWPIEELEAVRNEIPAGKWQAQYQQQPTSEATAIIKREWWQEWKEKDPPKCDFLLMSMDTAFEKKTSADYSAIVIFGVWNNPEDGDQPNLILLEAWRERLEFPDLKQRTLEFYKEWEPDGVIIEKKASGAPLIYELRRMGIPVQEFTPSRGQDKISRLNAVADIFASGKVWAPLTRWADEVINEIASFPAGRNDDFVDAVTLALARFRSGGFIGSAKDKDIDEDNWMYKKRANYY
jgi:predicted phage terminase large subunit-like protein